MSMTSENKQKAPPRAFNSNDLRKLRQAATDLRDTQLGALMEPFTADELIRLFCPKAYRDALRLVYKIESRIQAYGNIYLDLTKLMPSLDNNDWLFPDDAFAYSKPTKAVLKFYLHRDNMPDGFITPEPVFGDVLKPVQTYKGDPDMDLRGDFAMRAERLLRCAGEWMFVMWVLQKLQESVRTPPQVRYVWPAIQTLAKVGELDMDLTQTSVRAGLNATPDPEIAPYMRATNDVIANAVLLGVKNELMTRYRRNEMVIVDSAFSLGNTDKVITIHNA